jgi:predicted metal-binding membrane protein
LSATSTSTAPTLRQVTLPASILLVVAAVAWLVVVAVARRNGAMPGTMGFGFGTFVAVWALMMTAMMLPTTAPFAALYTRTLNDHRPRRIGELACGYLLVWTAAALPAYGLARLAGALVGTRPTAAKVLAATIFAVCGLYQLTPVKDRCLTRCRSPLGFVLQYGNYRGRLRDLRVGVSHGAFCLACCWALMAVLGAAGLMNLAVMVLLATVVLVEKTWTWGPRFSRVVGVLALVLAIAVLFRPTLAPGLYQATMGGSGVDMSDASAGHG